MAGIRLARNSLPSIARHSGLVRLSSTVFHCKMSPCSAAAMSVFPAAAARFHIAAR